MCELCFVDDDCLFQNYIVMYNEKQNTATADHEHMDSGAIMKYNMVSDTATFWDFQ